MKEYVDLVTKGLFNLDKVVEGIKNEIKNEYNMLSEDDKNIILSRRLVCHSCPFSSTVAQTSEEYFSLFQKSYFSSRNDEHCSLCSCNIKLKTASLLSNCGAENYNLTHEDKIPLKWEAKILK